MNDEDRRHLIGLAERLQKSEDQLASFTVAFQHIGMSGASDVLYDVERELRLIRSTMNFLMEKR